MQAIVDGKAIEFDCPGCGRGVRDHASKGVHLCSECTEEAHGTPRAETREEWMEHYNRWAEEALHECHDGSGGVVDDTPLDRLRAYENGQVHIQGSMIMTEKGYVTPWKESEHYALYPKRQEG